MFGAIEAFIIEQLEATGLASLAVAVVHQGRILWERGLGWADRERKLRASAHTRYSIASVTKPMTATALMRLVKRGLIDLDRPMNAYLGDARIRACIGHVNDATVRRVASHSSGLPTHYHLFYSDEPTARPPMVETIRRYGVLVQPPGEGYWYSNLGYGLLDYAISQVSGQSYDVFMCEQVFAPLGMFQASVGPNAALEGDVAVRYAADGTPLPFYDLDHRGGSAVFCSAHDLARFALFHLQSPLPEQDAVLSAESIEEMQKPQIEMHARGAYGLGWSIRYDDHGYRSVAHGGEMAGVRSLLKLIPSEGLGVAVLTNGETRVHFDVAREILRLLLPDYAERGEPDEASDTRSGKPPCALPAALRGSWIGEVETYSGSRSLTLTFGQGDQLQAQLATQSVTSVEELSFSDDILTGKLRGDLQTDDTRGHNLLLLCLTWRGERLTGALTATVPPGQDQRMRSGLSHWVDLRRDPSRRDTSWTANTRKGKL
ncbi:MAG: beta-lactamase family protein [Anaerolineae bacterium]|nr:beta-lactamase family protein [Anaerolineae bacterium]